MAPNIMLLKDVDTRSRNWTCQVLVLEQDIPHLTKEGRPYKRFILQDIEGNKVQATIFRGDIDVFKNNLKLYHTYAISNANVTPIDEIYRAVKNNYQWVISSRTPVQEIQIDGLTLRTVKQNFMTISDIPNITEPDPRFVLKVGERRKTTKTYVAELRIIDQRCMNNAAAIKALPDNNSSPSAMIRASQLPKELMTKIANLPTIVDTMHMMMMMWCNHCNQQLPPMATLKFEIEVTDSTGSITATIFDMEAKNIFNITVAEIKEICPNGQLTPIVKQKLSTPKRCDINLKVYNYNFGGISQCKFMVKSLYPAAPELKDQILPLPTLTLPRKSQKQLFKDKAPTNSRAAEDEEMENGTEDTTKLQHSKKRN